jgi:allantoicase
LTADLPIFDENLGVMVTKPENEFAWRYVNLADSRLGATAIAATDEYFAPAERLLNPTPAAFIAGKYDDHGKWMDGWETRRKRVEGYDHCILLLGLPGVIRGIDIDTSHFTGNFPPAASIDVCCCEGDLAADTAWTELLSSTRLTGNAHHVLPVSDERSWSHVRLNIYPDGGIARLRVYGEVRRDFTAHDRRAPVDLLAVTDGGRLIACSDQHYGTPLNIAFPGVGANMGEGWETHRRREPGNEWAIFCLGQPGEITHVEIDTTHFKGNAPDTCSIQAAYVSEGTEQSTVTQSMFWRYLLPEQELQPDLLHSFERQVAGLGAVTHIRLNVIPDGGINRMRLFEAARGP